MWLVMTPARNYMPDALDRGEMQCSNSSFFQIHLYYRNFSSNVTIMYVKIQIELNCFTKR